MAILSSGEYPEIRAALDTSLDTDVLPDSILAMSIYSGAADAAVIDRDPDAESRTGDEATHVLNAAIFFCAAFLAPAVPNILHETYPGQKSYQIEEIDWKEKEAHLLKRANEELEAVLDPTDTTPGRPTMFIRAIGNRGR